MEKHIPGSGVAEGKVNASVIWIAIAIWTPRRAVPLRTLANRVGECRIRLFIPECVIQFGDWIFASLIRKNDIPVYSSPVFFLLLVKLNNFKIAKGNLRFSFCDVSALRIFFFMKNLLYLLNIYSLKI